MRTTKQVFSKEFEELCYKHLLFGQCKQQSFANWLNTTQQTRNWNISILDETFTLNPKSDTAIEMPLQLIGSHDKDLNRFQFAYNTQQFINDCPKSMSEINKIKLQFPEIPEFQQPLIANYGDNIGYIFSSIIASILNVDGYYVGYGMNGMHDSEKEQSTMIFILLNELRKYTNYNEKEWIISDFEYLMNSWDYTFNHLCSKSNLLLKDNAKIFDNLFKHYNIHCKLENIENDKSETHSKLILEQNMFNINSMEFDQNGDIYAINDIIIAEHELTV